jgi:hypothetical protein
MSKAKKENPFIGMPIEVLDTLFASTDSLSPDLVLIGEAIDCCIDEDKKDDFDKVFSELVNGK